jgi:hypothetical protein
MLRIDLGMVQGAHSNALWGKGKGGENRSARGLRLLAASCALALALVFPVAAGAAKGSSGSGKYCWSSSCLASLTYAEVDAGADASLDDAAWYDAAWYDASLADTAEPDAAWSD